LGTLQANQIIKGNGCTLGDLIRTLTKTAKKKAEAELPRSRALVPT